MSQKNQLSRRTFLRYTRNTTLAAGLGLTCPSIFLNKTFAATGEQPSELIHIGFIGVGGQGNGNLNGLMKNAFALCDVDKNHLAATQKNVQDKTGRKCAGYGDYRKMLEDKSIDAVLIATPDHWHALPTIHACQAGKDVYCEKPLTLTIAEGQAMLKAARQYNRIVQTGSQQRSDSKFLKACELVRSGRLGKIKTVEVGIAKVNYSGGLVPDSEPPAELDYDMWLGPAPKRPYNKLRVHYQFRFFWDYSGGQMTNWGAHHLDITQWGLGMDESGPLTIDGKARFQKSGWYEVPEWSQITYQYPGDITVICSMDYPMGAKFIGEKGSIYINRGRLESDPEDIIAQPLTDKDVRLYASKSHHGNWLECIKTRKLPICDVAIGHRSATVCHLGNISIRTGRKITWDPKKEEIVGDPEASKLMTYSYRAPWKLPV